MGKRTGKPRGRPVGAQGKKQKALKAAQAKLAKQVEAMIAEPFTGNAHAFLMGLYKDPLMPVGVRLDAAKAAMKHETPTLTPIVPKKADEEIVPLAERLKAYATVDAVNASANVVPLKAKK